MCELCLNILILRQTCNRMCVNHVSCMVMCLHTANWARSRFPCDKMGTRPLGSSPWAHRGEQVTGQPWGPPCDSSTHPIQGPTHMQGALDPFELSWLLGSAFFPSCLDHPSKARVARPYIKAPTSTPKPWGGHCVHGNTGQVVGILGWSEV